MNLHLEKEITEIFENICGKQFVFTEKAILEMYEYDHTLNLHYPFEILVKPGDSEEISSILKICNQYKIPLTPRGGGTGVTGGALPLEGGVVLSLERLNKIVDLNKISSYIIAEAGVITKDLCDFVENNGLYFPVFPTSGYKSFIGGNVAENAGSAKSCKYGTTSKYVLNLEVVLPSGDIIWTGANVPKNVSGLNITPMFVGSEGTIGIITKVVYSLLPKPSHEKFLLVGFNYLSEACDFVIKIKELNISPASVEIICRNAIKLTSEYLKEDLPLIKENLDAHLLIGLEEFTEMELDVKLEQIGLLCGEYSTNNAIIAHSDSEKKILSKLRHSIGDALTAGRREYRDIDACVPLPFLYNYIKKVESICRESKIDLACFGHALDGNLHSNIIFNKKSFSLNDLRLTQSLNKIFKYVISIGGVISGEHGIGILQKDYLPLQLSVDHLNLIKDIKSILDPNKIMNPGKMI